MHLASIEARRPIERIPVERRAAAAELRAWYRDEFAADRRHLERGDHGDEGEGHER